jgi:hypothetical protein
MVACSHDCDLFLCFIELALHGGHSGAGSSLHGYGVALTQYMTGVLSDIARGSLIEWALHASHTSTPTMHGPVVCPRGYPIHSAIIHSIVPALPHLSITHPPSTPASLRPSLLCPSIHPSIYPSTISPCIHPSIHSPIYHPSLSLSIHLSVPPSIHHSLIHPFISPSIHTSVICNPTINPSSTLPPIHPNMISTSVLAMLQNLKLIH